MTYISGRKGLNLDAFVLSAKQIRIPWGDITMSFRVICVKSTTTTTTTPCVGYSHLISQRYCASPTALPLFLSGNSCVGKGKRKKKNLLKWKGEEKRKRREKNDLPQREQGGDASDKWREWTTSSKIFQGHGGQNELPKVVTKSDVRYWASVLFTCPSRMAPIKHQGGA